MIDFRQFIRPSSAAAIAACPGRPVMEARMCGAVPGWRDIASGPAKEGQDGHWALATILGTAFSGDWSNATAVLSEADAVLPRTMPRWVREGVRACLRYAVALIEKASASSSAGGGAWACSHLTAAVYTASSPATLSRSEASSTRTVSAGALSHAGVAAICSK